MSEGHASFDTTEERNKFLENHFVDEGVEVDLDKTEGIYYLSHGGHLVVKSLSVAWFDRLSYESEHYPFADGPSLLT